MRKVIKCFEELVSFLLVFFGIVVCMCETQNVGEQLSVMLLGVAIIAIGTAIGLFSKEVCDVTG